MREWGIIPPPFEFYAPTVVANVILVEIFWFEEGLKMHRWVDLKNEENLFKEKANPERLCWISFIENHLSWSFFLHTFAQKHKYTQTHSHTHSHTHFYQKFKGRQRKVKMKCFTKKENLTFLLVGELLNQSSGLEIFLYTQHFARDNPSPVEKKNKIFNQFL